MKEEIIPINGKLKFRKPNESDMLTVAPHTVKQAQSLPVTECLKLMLEKAKEYMNEIWARRNERKGIETAITKAKKDLGMNPNPEQPNIKTVAPTVKKQSSLKPSSP